MTTASNPVRLSVAGKRPPNVESKNRLVSGDLAATHARLLPGTVVSVMGPTEKTIALAGSNASTPAGTRAYSRRAAHPLAPRNARGGAPAGGSVRGGAPGRAEAEDRAPEPRTVRALGRPGPAGGG